MARKKSAGKKKSSGKKKSARARKPAPRKSAKNKTRSTAVARSARRKAAARPPEPRRAGAAAPRMRVTVETVTVEAAVLETAGGRVEALKEKLAALQSLEGALSARLTGTPSDDDELNPSLEAIRNQQQVVQAEIASALTPTLAPPSDADMQALRAAVRGAEDVIARNAAVNQLVKAATALIKTLNA
jgi:hypothetical protein